MQTATVTQSPNDLDDLMPPDIRADVRAEFRDAGRQVAQPEAVDETSKTDKGDGRGDAEGVLVSRPSPNDDFGARAYGRDTDTTPNQSALMTAALVATAYAGSQGDDDTPQPQGPDFASYQASAPNYQALDQPQASAPQPGAKSNEIDDLMPPEIKADIKSEAARAGQEVTDRSLDDLMPPDIRADVQSENMGRTQTRGLGL